MRSPLYEAQHAPRYERQALIRHYQETYGCRLVVLMDALFPYSIAPFEELLHDANPDQDMHVMLATPGGDGETALRLVRQVQSRCRQLTVIVPDQAKSAGTLFVLGAHSIYMGPTSDLGPVDPQFRLSNGSLAPGKAIIAAVEEAERRIQENPQTYPLHASLLSDITGLMVQQARDSLAHTGDLLREVLACVPERSAEDVKTLAETLHDQLIGGTQDHGATISTQDATDLGLPVEKADPSDPRWRAIWRMWTKYIVLNAARVYEGESASYVVHQLPV
jgi:hypothetical protein